MGQNDFVVRVSLTSQSSFDYSSRNDTRRHIVRWSLHLRRLLHSGTTTYRPTAGSLGIDVGGDNIALLPSLAAGAAGGEDSSWL